MMDVVDDEGIFGGDDVEKAQDLHTILLVFFGGIPHNTGEGF
jgi:hypothetical protein